MRPIGDDFPKAQRQLALKFWPQITASTTTLLVPVGSTEQHGPHLPLCTDTLIAEALADRVAADHPDWLVAPAVAYGSSGEHSAFPGTLSIGSAALEFVLLELGRSADDFKSIMFVSGHGGNAAPVARATATLRAEGRKASWWGPKLPGGDAHAGRTETSIVLAIAPELVEMELAAPGNLDPLVSIIDRMVEEGVSAVSSNGVLGDPLEASAEEGEELIDVLLASLEAAIFRLNPGREFEVDS